LSDEGAIICCGAQLADCLKAADLLRDEEINVGVINARFVKPLDREVVLRAVRDCAFVVTVEESSLMGGFGSAVLEAAADAGLNTGHIRRLGIPDKFIEHANGPSCWPIWAWMWRELLGFAVRVPLLATHRFAPSDEEALLAISCWQRREARSAM